LLHTIRKTALTVGVIGAAGLGGATLADAAGTKSATPTKQTREALSADVAAKVKAAALAKVPGATVLRTEAGGPDNAAYHAHIKTSDGTLKTVLVNASFVATDVVADQGRGGRGGGRGHGAETALTGDTKTKVEAAVLARYAGATIVRSETNGDSAAPYEAHITTKDGKELEVLVSKDFAVLDAREHR
jgi:uncharacterized membrane protein YkoI